MFRKLSLTLAISAALSPIGAYALGLGEIATRSALNESFNAQIQLLDVESGELDDVRVQLASPTDFAKAGLDRPYLLSKLIFKPVEADNGDFNILVTTDDPVREPFMNFLVEVNWPKGRLLREFTVLLDPPVTTGRKPPPISLAQVEAAPSLPREEVYAPPAMVEEPVVPFEGDYYIVPRGTTLWSVASELAVPGASTEQVLMALYRANPHAFANGDVNNLLAGARLQVPDSDQVMSVTVPQARAEFRGLSRGESVPMPQDRLHIASSKPVESKQPTPAAQGQGDGDFEQVKTDLMMVRETSESTRQETENLRTRIRELESQLNDITQLLQLKNDQLAQIQQQSGDTPLVDEQPEVEVAEFAEEAPPVERIEIEEQAEAASAVTEQPVAEEVVVGTEQVTVEPPQEVEVERPAAAVDMPASEAVMPEVAVESPVVGEQAQTAEPVAQESVSTKQSADAPTAEQAVAKTEAKPADKPEVKKPAKAEQKPAKVKQEPKKQPKSKPKQEEPSLLDGIMGDPTLMAAGAGGGVALLGLLWWLLRRRRSAEEEFQESVLISSSDVSTVEIEDDDQEIESRADSGEDTSFISDFSPSDIDALQEETGEVDPAAEADVYIAYGRYQQAENLITQALEKSPDRADLQFKLLEIYFTTRNISSFVGLAEKMQSNGVPTLDPATWSRVQSMGRELAPSNDLFGGADDSALESLVADDVSTGSEGFSEPNLGGLDSDSEVLANLDLDLDSSLSELDASPLGGQSEFQEAGYQGGDAGSVLEPPPAVDHSSESSPLSDPLASSTPIQDESDFALDLNSLDSMDLGELDLDQVSAPPSGSPKTAGEVSRSEANGLETLQVDDEISALNLDGFDQKLEPESGLDDSNVDDEAPLSELLDDLGAQEEEVDTKLDLAKAYAEMGDAEGAREILEEVLEEGNEQQKAEAQEVMGSIG